MNSLPEKFHFFEVKNVDKSVLSIKNKIFQRKLDGTMAEVFINDNIRIFGRGVIEYGISSEYTKKFPEIIEGLKKLNIPRRTNFVGEIIVIDPKTGFENIKLVESRALRDRGIELNAKLNPALFVILDVVEVGGEDIKGMKYIERLEILKKSISRYGCDECDKCDKRDENDRICFIKNEVEFNLDDWNYIEKNKLEGIIIRDADSKYGNGIWKMKTVYTEDVYCKGEYNKSEKLKEFASLICYQIRKDDGFEIYVTDVGGGFTDKERKEIQKLLDKGLMKDNPLVIEIKTFGKTEKGKFRSPVFLKIRYDKPWSQCFIT